MAEFSVEFENTHMSFTGRRVDINHRTVEYEAGTKRRLA